jgi:hypothetical protein
MKLPAEDGIIAFVSDLHRAIRSAHFQLWKACHDVVAPLPARWRSSSLRCSSRDASSRSDGVINRIATNAA